jgi:enamine deaminase RidA (YjgF/YER057c/UK114 family)
VTPSSLASSATPPDQENVVFRSPRMIVFRIALPALLAVLTAAAPAFAQDALDAVKRIPAPHGEVIIATPRQQQNYDTIRFAPARRAGDTLYISGVIVGRAEGEGTDAEAFKAQVRRAFQAIETTLKASGAGFEDVVMINSFHVWEGPDQPAPRWEQLQMFNAVKDEFMKAPHPAWTAVGTTGLLAPRGIVEVQMIAKVPGR